MSAWAEDREGLEDRSPRHVCRSSPRPSPVPDRLEQRPHHRSEAPAHAEACLVDPGPARDGGQPARPCALQHGGRQQAPRLRPRRRPRARRLFSRTRQGARLDRPDEDRSTRPLRDHRDDPAVARPLDRRAGDARGRPSLAQQVPYSPHLSTRQYARIVRGWVTSIGLEPSAYGTHSMRRTKVAQIYKKTGNLRAVQLLLGHTKMDSTVRYLGVDLDDALAISEAIDL
jgi:hypothetical protein